ncbi:MAG: ribose 5-phosphate isomerase B [Eubacteriaceae bacterium]|nr:ribose 5-phosphate isomerase B [Eubacteriaceae bacterium]
MRVAIGSDHGGYGLKEHVKEYLEAKGHEVSQCGCYSIESVDYPEFAREVARQVADGSVDFGVLFCTTGIGMSIAANKVEGIRAALCHNTMAAKMSRMHNNANIICIGALFVGNEEAEEMVDLFLEEPYEGGRHDRRIGMLKLGMDIEGSI